jgi:Cu(I)/Ag(I) efflux system membrane fusion protein
MASALRFSILIGAFWCAACSAQAGPTSTVEAQAVKPALGQGTASQNLINAYLVLQAKLAHDDVAGARAGFGSVLAAARVSSLEIAADLRKRIDGAAAAGGAAADIAKQRAAFGSLSAALIAWFAVQANPLSDGLTVAHCPMAFDGKGAKWLQRGEQIRNPYFGTEMLSCGAIDATLGPGKKL